MQDRQNPSGAPARPERVGEFRQLGVVGEAVGPHLLGEGGLRHAVGPDRPTSPVSGSAKVHVEVVATTSR